MAMSLESQLHKLASRVSVSVWTTLWEGNYSPREGPGEDELYDVVLDSLTRALKYPEERRDLARALAKK